MIHESVTHSVTDQCRYGAARATKNMAKAKSRLDIRVLPTQITIKTIQLLSDKKETNGYVNPVCLILGISLFSFAIDWNSNVKHVGIAK